MRKKMKNKITIIGCGNIGNAIAQGLVKSKKYVPENIILTRRSAKHLHEFQKQGFTVSTDNCNFIFHFFCHSILSMDILLICSYNILYHVRLLYQSNSV